MSRRGLSVLDLLIVLSVLAVLLLASAQEFPSYDQRAVEEPTPMAEP